jgi:membrane protease YdiL (CAAX protease family)
LSQLFFASCKVWIFLVPTIWYLKVEKKPISKNSPTKEGIVWGLITGILMSLIIVITWFLFNETLDIDGMVDILQSKGLDDINLYIIGMFYWIFINSLLEEYVFRWFITTKSSELFRSDVIGIIFSAAMFTLHHAIALYLFGFIWWQTIIACFGLLSAAAIWSLLYVRFRSIWVCWLSHAICDVAVFGIGYTILF